MAQVKKDRAMHVYDTGATRSADADKLDFEAFICPLVELRFAEYMHKHRWTDNGELRDGDNWQKGFPLDRVMKSLTRHFYDLRLLHRGFAHNAENPDIEEVLCAIRFNVDAYLRQILIERGRGSATL